jgi:hypothetical protein
MREYKIGQKVRVSENPTIDPNISPVFINGSMDECKGKEVTIIEVRVRDLADFYSQTVYKVKEYMWAFAESWLEPIVAAPTFGTEIKTGAKIITKAESIPGEAEVFISNDENSENYPEDKSDIIQNEDVPAEKIKRPTANLLIDDDELLIVFKTLLSRLKEGKNFIFLPWKINLPSEKIMVPDDFSLEGEEIKKLNTDETLRLLGVTLHHLITGKSELTHESFIIDGYRYPLVSGLWPVISSLLRKKYASVEEVEKELNAIGTDKIKADIQPVQFTANVVTIKVRTANDILQELANEKIKIIGHEDVAKFWDIPVPQDVQIRYSAKTLHEAIEANQNGEQWALAYYAGHSLKKMYDKRGINKAHKPCFYNNDWWLASTYNNWVTRTLESGYYLLNYTGYFINILWAAQETLIADMGPTYERAHEIIVGETILSNYEIHNGEELLNDWYHWGYEITSDSDHKATIGDLESGGLHINGHNINHHNADKLKVVLCRKFDF